MSIQSKRKAFYLLRLIVVSVAYYATARYGLGFDPVSGFATLVWPPSGIAVAALFLGGLRLWPGVFLAAFAVNFSVGAAAPYAFGIAVGNTLEAVVCVAALRALGFTKNFARVRDVWWFSVLSWTTAMIAATIGTTTLWFAGSVTDYALTWRSWLVGDALGIVILAPFFFSWIPNLRTLFRERIKVKRAAELVVIFSVLIVVGFGAFGGLYPNFTGTFFLLLLFPIFWIAIRFDLLGASLALVFLSAVSIWGVTQGVIASSDQSLSERLLGLQLFLGIIGVVMWVLVALVHERVSVESRFHAIVEKSFDAVMFWDKSGRITYASPSSERILGYAPGELIGRIGTSLIHPDDLQRFESLLEELLKKPGHVITTELRKQKKNGTWVWVESVSTNLLQDPSIQAIVRNYRDITERKKVEEVQAYYGLTVRQSNEAIYTMSPEGNIRTWNPAAAYLYGYTEKEMLGKSLVSVLIPEDRRAEWGKNLDAVRQGKAIMNDETQRKRKDGTVIDVAVSWSPIKNSVGELLGISVIARDVTEKKRLDKAKTEFISLASHQLRTPLTVIKWYLNIISREYAGQFPKKMSEDLKEAEEANQRMADLLKQLLNVSRLEMGTYAVVPRPTNIQGTLDIVLAHVAKKMADQGLLLVKKYLKDPPVLMVDSGLFQMVAMQLVSNAVNYTPKGGTITVEVHRRPEATDIVISDTGYGIPKAQQSRVFTKLFRADNVVEKEILGTGLGLYVAKVSFQNAGCGLTFASEEGVGSSFTIHIPASGMLPHADTKGLEIFS